jgi:cytochrome P450
VDNSIPSLLSEAFPWPRGLFDAPAAYGELRKARPVIRVTLRSGKPAWLITRYDDVRSILSDPRVSSDTRNPGYPALGYSPPPERRSLLNMDPPNHTVLRRLLVKNFLVKRVESLRADIQALVDSKIDTMLATPERRADLVQSFALPVPSTVLSWILGVRQADIPFFNKVSEDIVMRAASRAPDAPQRTLDSMAILENYIAELVKERESQDPGNDILGQLITESRAGTITRQDVINTGVLVLIAGHDTTASMTALGTLTLLQHPDQLAELRAKPELISDAVEELLRYLTIVHLVVRRVAKEDIEIGGEVIPAGEGIIPLNLSANRDDAHYPDAATFDIHRKARDHFAFGYGIHQCVGQPLARVELQVIFETLLRRIPTLRLAIPIGNVPFKSGAPIHGVLELPVTW